MELLDINEVSQWLKVKRATLYAWAAKGKIPCIRMQGLVRFARTEVEQWLDAQRLAEPEPLPHMREPSEVHDVDRLIARAKAEVYTSGRGETRPKSSLIRKGG